MTIKHRRALRILRARHPAWHIWPVGGRWWAHRPGHHDAATVHADTLANLAHHLGTEQDSTSQAVPC